MQDDIGGTAVVLRYDTQASFTSSSSYASFDLTRIDSRAPGYRGAVYVKPYVYFVPGEVEVDAAQQASPILRYDPTADGTFDDPTAWSQFDETTLATPIGHEYWGGTSDGKNVYFTPFSFAPQAALKYDTTAAFGVLSSH